LRLPGGVEARTSASGRGTALTSHAERRSNLLRCSRASTLREPLERFRRTPVKTGTRREPTPHYAMIRRDSRQGGRRSRLASGKSGSCFSPLPRADHVSPNSSTLGGFAWRPVPPVLSPFESTSVARATPGGGTAGGQHQRGHGVSRASSSQHPRRRVTRQVPRTEAQLTCRSPAVGLGRLRCAS
jgi:hypothetical protein